MRVIHEFYCEDFPELQKWLPHELVKADRETSSGKQVSDLPAMSAS